MRIKVYYDYHQDHLVPIWYVISFRKGDLDWSKNIVYVPVEGPFECVGSEDFLPDSIGITVTLSELTFSSAKSGKFGICLHPLRKRAVENGSDYWEAEQLIIQVSDIEELLQMNVFV